MWRLDGPCKMFHVEHFDTFSDGQGRAPRQTVPFDRPGNRTPGTRWETLPGINSRNPHPQAAACGSEPPHKSGRPGDRFSCDARGTTRRPVISSCRRQFSADPQLAPGFLKGPAGPLSRAPRLGTRGGFFRRFLTGQKAAVCRQELFARSAAPKPHKGLPNKNL